MWRRQAQGAAQGIDTQPVVQTIAAEQKRIAGMHLKFQHIQGQLLGRADRAGQGMCSGMVLGLFRAHVLFVDQLLLQ